MWNSTYRRCIKKYKIFIVKTLIMELSRIKATAVPKIHTSNSKWKGILVFCHESILKVCFSPVSDILLKNLMDLGKGFIQYKVSKIIIYYVI